MEMNGIENCRGMEQPHALGRQLHPKMKAGWTGGAIFNLFAFSSAINAFRLSTWINVKHHADITYKKIVGSQYFSITFRLKNCEAPLTSL